MKPKSKMTMMNFITTKKVLSKKERNEMTSSVEDYLIQSNCSLSTVENPAFRKMLFKFNSGYVAPSRTSITSHIDKKIKEKKEELKKEIEEDTRESKTASVTTDGGPSQDKNNTKKNSVTISRISSQWKMKTDTLALEVAEGSQTGVVIRTVVKGVLDKFGFSGDINMTTDDASAARSARTPNRHPEVGLSIKYEVMCIDHQIHLLIEEVIKSLRVLLEALARVREFVTMLKRCAIARRELLEIQKSQGVDQPLCPIMGTKNRWFHKYKEAGRLFELREAVGEFDYRHSDDDTDISGLYEEHWRHIAAYLAVVKPFVKATVDLGGDTYPAACIVVPMLDQLRHDLVKLPDLMERDELRRESGDRRQVKTWGAGCEGRQLVEKTLERFDIRFPSCFKLRAPFNSLCMLDPRNLDLFCETEAELKSAIDTIKQDRVYNSIRVEVDSVEEMGDDQNNVVETAADNDEEPNSRRAQLLAKRRSLGGVPRGAGEQARNTFEEKVEEEINRFRALHPVERNVNPLDWWKLHETEYPLLALFMKSNAAFQPTSLASERLFNKDRMLYGTTRQQITQEHGEGYVFLHDYLNKRMQPEEFKICTRCPNPPDNNANYRITCGKHNK